MRKKDSAERKIFSEELTLILVDLLFKTMAIISRMHPIANWLRCRGTLYNLSLNRVRNDHEAEVQVNPNHSGLPPKSKTYFWNEQLPNLVQEDFYAEQVEARIKDLDFRANNIRKEINAQTESRVDEANRMEMESDRLKEILEESKKND